MGKDTDDDFLEAMQDVKPLEPANRARVAGPARAPVPVQRHQDDAFVMRTLLSEDPLASELESGEEFEYARPGVQIKTLKRLRRGDYRVEAELDLHGDTVDVARERLHRFIAKAQQEQVRCLRIIHGKGLRSPNREPVLKHFTQSWLVRIDAVLAVATTPSNDGGTGALYVLLRKPGSA